MKVALIGASGNVGSRLLAELLNRGHEVTGIVRHPEKLRPHESLIAKRGDINDEAGLARFSVDTSGHKCRPIPVGRSAKFNRSRQESGS